MAARQFSADRDTLATRHEFWRRENARIALVSSQLPHGLLAAIGHVHHVDLGHHPEQLAAEMGQVSGAGRGQVDLAGVGLGIVDELADGFGGEERIDQQDEGVAG